jgi:DNA polymerase-4
MTALCRECGASPGDAVACPACGSRRIARHAELVSLAIAHVDCDAFYASVEKRDRPELASRPVIVGGTGSRGVVSTCCYVARIYGVRSAMPMYQALKACPDAVVIKPDFSKYTAASRQIRGLMMALTPLVQPLSIDEATLDLSGTEALHGAPPAAVLMAFARKVEAEVGVTVSIGLAANRLMAKIAAGRDKPRGFTVIGAEAAAMLSPEPVRLLPGIGPAFAKKLDAMGITKIGQLQGFDDREARRRFGDDGPSLVRRARGEDARVINPTRETKSISAETTFNTDLSNPEPLERELWRLSEKLGRRLRAEGFAAVGVVLKLKTAAFASRTRSQRLPQPSVLPDTLFNAARVLLGREIDGTQFRLIGIGATSLTPLEDADRPDLADPGAAKRIAAQGAIDALRAKFGDGSVVKGRGLDALQPRADGSRHRNLRSVQ